MGTAVLVCSCRPFNMNGVLNEVDVLLSQDKHLFKAKRT